MLNVYGQIEEDSDSEFDVCDLCKAKLSNDDERYICDAGHIFCEKHMIYIAEEFVEKEDDVTTNISCEYCPACDKKIRA
jgi:hypothetical protein